MEPCRSQDLGIFSPTIWIRSRRETGWRFNAITIPWEFAHAEMMHGVEIMVEVPWPLLYSVSMCKTHACLGFPGKWDQDSGAMQPSCRSPNLMATTRRCSLNSLQLTSTRRYKQASPAVVIRGYCLKGCSQEVSKIRIPDTRCDGVRSPHARRMRYARQGDGAMSM